LAADPIAQSWYPLTLLAYLPQGWNAFVILGFVLLASFTYGYVFAVTRCRLAGVASGLVFGLSGVLHSTLVLGHLTVLHTLVWIPLALWGFERLRYECSVPWLIATSLAVASACLAGHAQVLLYAMTVLLGYVLVSAMADARGRWPFLGRSGWILVVGIGLAAVQLLPSAELASVSLRPEMTLAQSTSFAVEPSGAAGGLFFHPANRLGISAYVGWVTLFLGVVGLMSHHPRWRTAFWGTTAVIAFVLSLGAATPLAGFVYRVPLYSLFRVPARHLLEMTFALSILSGIGVAALHRRIITPALLIRGTTAGLVLLATGVSILVIFAQAGFRPVVTRGFDSPRWPSLADGGVTLPLLALLALMAVLALWIARSNANWLAAAAVLILGADLFGTEWGAARNLPWPRVAELDPPAHAEQYRRLLAIDHQRMLPIRGGSGARDELPPNLSRLWGIPSASGYGPLIPARLSRLLAMSPVGDVSGGWADPSNRALDIMAVRYVFLPEHAQTSQGVPAALAREDWKRVERVRDTVVLENLRALPRVWLVPHIRVHQPEHVLRAIRTSTLHDGEAFDPRQLALVEQAVDFDSGVPDFRGEARVLNLSDTVLEVRTRSQTQAFLVIGDAYYPGWQAWMDGTAVQLFRTNYVLRGLVVPTGEHLVRLEFRPVSVYAGAALSLLAAVVAALTAVTWTTGSRDRTARMTEP
jgi:hypothetical protein